MMMVIIIIIILRKSNKAYNALYEKNIHCRVTYGKMGEREKQSNGPKYGINCKYFIPGPMHFCLEHKI